MNEVEKMTHSAERGQTADALVLPLLTVTLCFSWSVSQTMEDLKEMTTVKQQKQKPDKRFTIDVCLQGDQPGLRLSLRRCCLLTKQAARVLNSTAAAKKQIVATTPATTGRANPSSATSAGGKGSDGGSKEVRTREQIFLFQCSICEETDLYWIRLLRCCSHWSGLPWQPSPETHTRTPTRETLFFVCLMSH